MAKKSFEKYVILFFVLRFSVTFDIWMSFIYINNFRPIRGMGDIRKYRTRYKSRTPATSKMQFFVYIYTQIQTHTNA